MKRDSLVIAQRLIRIEDVVKVLTFVISVLGFLSVVREVELLYSLTFASLFFLSVSFEYRRTFPLHGWLLACMAVGVILLTVLRMNPDDFITLVVGALLILLAIRLLGAKRFRDYMQIYLIALFLLIGSALLSVEIEFLLYFVCMIFLVTVTIVFLTYFSQDNTLALPASAIARIASKASLISLIAIPVTAVMFIVLPRTSYPIFHFLNRGAHASTGFTDNVRLGNVSDIQEDTTVILRAHMERVQENLLYWRGIVLDNFDGTSWTSLHSGGPDSDRSPSMAGRQVKQTIYLEPTGNKYLFTLDKPASLSLRYAKRTSALTYTLSENIFRRIRYESASTLSDLLPEQKIDRSAYLQMPERALAKTSALVKTLSSGGTAEETARAILRFLRDGEYRYSLKNLPVSDDPLEDFLFRYKYGNCEYFASAMAVMLRIAGIPSRVVGGYKGGYYNDAGEYYLVPQKNAHVWVEAYIESKGWLRMDPTPAGIENFVSGSSRDLFFRAKLLMDSMNYYWNALVINYDFAKQVSLFNTIRSGIRNPRIRFSMKSGTVVRYSAALLCLALVILAIWRIAVRKKVPHENILKDFLKRMGRYGYEKHLSEGLEAFVARIQDERMRERAFRFVRAFEGYYYRDKRLSKEDIRRLTLLLDVDKRQ
jgi:transglutaminase-like putative cysteine protease